MIKKFRFIYFLALSSILILGACKTTQNLESPRPQGTSAKKEMTANTLLWKIEGNGITTPSYLFGTIHLIGQGDYFMNEATKTAVQNSQQVVLELDMDDPNLQMEIIQHAMMKDNMTIDQLLSKEDYEKLNTKMKESLGMGVDMFKAMSPMLVSSMLATKFIDGQPASYEQELIKIAKAQNKEVIGIESIAEQMGAINSISYKEQAEMLLEVVSDMEQAKSDFGSLVNIYKKQDIDGLHDMIIEQSGGEDFAEKLIYGRNRNWIDRIGKIAKEKSSFIAVGSGHLGGKQGVISLLRAAGYTVSPVM